MNVRERFNSAMIGRESFRAVVCSPVEYTELGEDSVTMEIGETGVVDRCMNTSWRFTRDHDKSVIWLRASLLKVIE